MAVFAIDEIIEATGAQLLTRGSTGLKVDAFAVDSRKVVPGSLFVAMAGDCVDGNDFVSDAIDAGASCVCITKEASSEVMRLASEHDCALLRADGDDGEEFLLRLAKAWRVANPHWRVVGITGSVGKTTTKEMVAAGVGSKRRVHATEGNYNSLIGMPLTLLAAPATTEVLVLEMGMNAAGEISRLSLAAAPDLAIITNIGTSHIGLLGGREEIARAKGEIVVGMSATVSTPTLVLDGSDAFSDFIASEIAAPAFVETIKVGKPDTTLWAEAVSLDEGGRASFTLHSQDGRSCRVHLGIPGRHVVSNCLLALEVASLLGVDLSAAATAIGHMPATHMRLELIETPGHPLIIDDSYNASPASMAAALDVLASSACTGNRVAVLGEMGELGEEAERFHGLVGAYAAASSPGKLVFIGSSLANAMADAALVMGYPKDQLESYESVDEAIDALKRSLKVDDLVLVKASRAAGLDRLVREVTAHVG